MAKSKANIPSIQEAPVSFAEDKFLPVYFFCGNDSYSIDAVVKELENSITSLIGSDFDKEIIYGDEKTNLSQLLSMASSFPFGSEKKFIVVKELDKIKDLKSLTAYVQNPPDFTTILFIYNGDLPSADKEPYKSLIAQKFVFEAKELKGENLINWLIEISHKNGRQLSHENATLLIEITGDNRSMLEDQLEKFFIYLKPNKEIDYTTIKALSASLKENTIFELNDSLGRKNKVQSVKVIYNLLEKGTDPSFIIAMLTKYFTGLSRVDEMNQKIPDAVAARIVGTHPFFYKNYQSARKIFSDKDLFRSISALLNADILLKTTTIDPKSIFTVLITDILK
ncbi:MAG: DNA polymerase III subunit delta [Ignavibacteriaceae bacterium]|nr:DNA polymerase III subunit delta [Ignavibacteriaceae bacterium]